MEREEIIQDLHVQIESMARLHVRHGLYHSEGFLGEQSSVMEVDFGKSDYAGGEYQSSNGTHNYSIPKCASRTYKCLSHRVTSLRGCCYDRRRTKS